jgi:hypothetical protein
MPAYFSLMVPGALALFAAVVGVAWVAIERRQARALEIQRLNSNRESDTA